MPWTILIWACRCRRNGWLGRLEYGQVISQRMGMAFTIGGVGDDNEHPITTAAPTTTTTDRRRGRLSHPGVGLKTGKVRS